MPAFDRVADSLEAREGAKLGSEERARRYDLMISEFRDACAGHGVSSSVLDNDVTLQALGQHYGLPTKLLDWTESPYVAAFFAFSAALGRESTRSEVAIWCLDTECGIWTAEDGVEIVAGRSFENIRLRNQTGRFTLSRTFFSSLNEYARKHPEAVVALTQCLLPSAEAQSALAELDVMGIRHDLLFPGLDGHARTVATRLLTGDLS